MCTNQNNTLHFQMEEIDFPLMSVGQLAAKLEITSATIYRRCSAAKLSATLWTQ